VTADDYLGFLVMTYLIGLIPAWSKNLTTDTDGGGGACCPSGSRSPAASSVGLAGR